MISGANKDNHDQILSQATALLDTTVVLGEETNT